MQLDIRAFSGMGPIELGMTRHDVGTVLDPIKTVRAFHQEYDGSEREFRSADLPIISYRDGRVCGVDTSWNVKNVLFQGVDVYESPCLDVLRLFEKENNGARIALGMVLFNNIGISTTGFYLQKEGAVFNKSNGVQDDRGLGIYVQNAFNEHIAMFEPISFL